MVWEFWSKDPVQTLRVDDMFSSGRGSPRGSSLRHQVLQPGQWGQGVVRLPERPPSPSLHPASAGLHPGQVNAVTSHLSVTTNSVVSTPLRWVFKNTLWKTTNLKENEAQSAHAESTHKGVNWHSKYVTQVQQQRPESPMVTLTWHACEYKAHKLHQRYLCYIFWVLINSFVWWLWKATSDFSVRKQNSVSRWVAGVFLLGEERNALDCSWVLSVVLFW